MKIKEIIESCAVYLGKQEIIDYFNGSYEYDTTEIEKNVNSMVKLCNLVISELSCGYIDLVKTEEIDSYNNKINLSTLSQTAVKILEVFDEKGNAIPFKVNSEFIQPIGEAKLIKYKYLAPNYELEDIIGYSEKEISLSTFAYGLCAEYCILECRFDQALMWRNRYVESINMLLKPKNTTLKGRTWLWWIIFAR